MEILLNEYESLGVLGQGSFAKIYKVRHLQLDCVRAIRVLNEIVSEKEEAWATFQLECKKLLQLGNGGHPNIVRIYKPLLLHNHALVEMDYIDGCDLDSYLSEQKNFIPADEIMRFAREIGGALAYCHEDCFEFLYNKEQVYEYRLESALKGQKFTIAPDPENAKKDLITELQRRELIREYGITHNDLHSKNIMRRKYDGSYILLDFGLAIQDGKAVKSSSRRDGAVEYKAPEKWEKNSDITPRSDIYGFGVILYEMLAGRVPFVFERDKYSKEEQALFELSIKHEKEHPPAIEPLRRSTYAASHPGQTYRKDYPDWLEQMILKCLAKRPEDRYANANEFVAELKKNLKENQIENGDQTQKLKEANDKMFNELSNLSREKSELNEQIMQLAKQLAKASNGAEELVEMQKKIKTLTDEAGKLKTEIAGKVNEATSQQQKIILLQTEKEEYEIGFSMRQKEIEKLKKEIVNRKNPKPRTPWIAATLLFAGMAVLCAFAWLAGINPTDDSAELGNYQNQIQQQTTIINDLQNQLDEKEQTITGLLNSTTNNSVLADRQKEIDGLTKEVATLKNDNASLQTTQDADKGTISQLQQEVSTLKNDNTALKANQGSSSADRNTISRLQQEKNSLTSSNQEKDRTITNLRSSNQEKDRTISKLQKDLKTAQDLIRSL